MPPLVSWWAYATSVDVGSVFVTTFKDNLMYLSILQNPLQMKNVMTTSICQKLSQQGALLTFCAVASLFRK